jgi:hypothetical protein
MRIVVVPDRPQRIRERQGGTSQAKPGKNPMSTPSAAYVAEPDLRSVIVSARWSGAVASALLAYTTTIIATRLFYFKTL